MKLIQKLKGKGPTVAPLQKVNVQHNLDLQQISDRPATITELNSPVDLDYNSPVSNLDKGTLVMSNKTSRNITPYPYTQTEPTSIP